MNPLSDKPSEAAAERLKDSPALKALAKDVTHSMLGGLKDALKEVKESSLGELLNMVGYLLAPEDEKEAEEAERDAVKKTAEQEHDPEMKKEALKGRRLSEKQEADVKKFIGLMKLKESGKDEDRGHRRINTKAIVINLEGRTNTLGKSLLKVWPKDKPLPGIPALSQKFHELFLNRLPDTFEEFEKACREAKIPVEVLARSAVGRYQIIPVYHFHRIGLNAGSLKDIYEFLKSPEKQYGVVRDIVAELGERYHWKPGAMGAAYYAGKKAGDAMANAKNPGDLPEWLTRGQAYGHGSIATYAAYMEKRWGASANS